jgi:hypothetical protein
MVYVMSEEEKLNQLGRLTRDRRASEESLGALTAKASLLGNLLVSTGRRLLTDPSLLAFPGDPVDSRFIGTHWEHSDQFTTLDEIRALTNAIRAEQLKLRELEAQLKAMGY